MAYLHVTDPTTDHAAVLRLLERYRTRSPRIEGRLQRDNRRLSGPNLPLSADTRSEIEQLFEGPGLPPVTILPDGAGGKGLGYNDYGYLARAIEYLRHVDGEKHLLAMLEKRMLLGRDGGDYLGRKAAAARVTVSPITTGGGDSAQSIRKGRVSSGYVGKWDASIDMKRSVDVQNLAELTGGLAASYQEVRKPLARLLRVNSFEYLLGYYPANPPADGEYRQVKVVVNRRGATLHYRHGYESKPKTDEPLDVRGMFTESRILQAASSTYGFVGFPIKIGASVTKGEPLQVVVDVAIDPKQITLTQSGDSYTAALDLAVYVADAHEKMLAEKRDRIELQVRAGELGRIRKEMIRRTVTLNVSRKADQVKVVVYDYDADRLGTASLRIR